MLVLYVKLLYSLKQHCSSAKGTLVKTLRAQLASRTVLHLHADFESDVPGKLAVVEGVEKAYLVPRSRQLLRCLVVHIDAGLLNDPQHLLRLVGTIGDVAWRTQRHQVELLCAVERRGGGELAQSLDDWVKLR